MSETLEFQKISFIKTDIEGYEFHMLNGAEEVLKKSNPVLYLELDDTFLKRAGSSLKETVTFLENLGYKPFIQEDKSAQFVPVDTEKTNAHDILWRHSS
jgi:Methyltransferase FkbM domain